MFARRYILRFNMFLGFFNVLFVAIWSWNYALLHRNLQNQDNTKLKSNTGLWRSFGISSLSHCNPSRAQSLMTRAQVSCQPPFATCQAWCPCAEHSLYIHPLGTCKHMEKKAFEHLPPPLIIVYQIFTERAQNEGLCETQPLPS